MERRKGGQIFYRVLCVELGKGKGKGEIGE